MSEMKVKTKWIDGTGMFNGGKMKVFTIDGKELIREDHAPDSSCSEQHYILYYIMNPKEYAYWKYRYYGNMPCHAYTKPNDPNTTIVFTPRTNSCDRCSCDLMQLDKIYLMMVSENRPYESWCQHCFDTYK